MDLVFLIPSFHFPRARAEVFLHVQSLDPFETTKWFQKNSLWFLAFAIQMHLHLTKLIHCEKEVPSCSNYKLFSMLSERASNVSSSVSFLVSQFKLSLWNLTILLNQHESLAHFLRKQLGYLHFIYSSLEISVSGHIIVSFSYLLACPLRSLTYT